MTIDIPKPLTAAQEKGIEYFDDDEHEWKLDLNQSSKHIEKVVGTPVLVFAKNGYGDHLFLKKSSDSTGYTEEVFKFLHEGPELEQVKEDLETLLGLKERPPSTDNYPKAI